MGISESSTFICNVWINCTCTILTHLPISDFVGIRYWYTFIHINHKSENSAYLGSSFAFITPIITGLSTHSLGDMLVALFMSGLMYVIIGIFIKLVEHIG